jgi:hypothetical protein
LQIKTKNFICHMSDSKPVKQEVNSTVILPPLVFAYCHCKVSYCKLSIHVMDDNSAYFVVAVI